MPESSQTPSNPIVSGADLIWVQDNGSSCQCAKVLVEGVPAEGIIDSGSDITIMGGDLFRKVSAVGRLKGRTFKKVDKVPHTYDRRPFSLDGKMDMHITFCGMTMRSPVYVKHDVPEQLLLSEGVCRQLQIIWYHSDIVMHNNHNRIGRKKRMTTPTNTKTTPITMEQRSAADTVSHSTSSPVDTETLTDSVLSPASSEPVDHSPHTLHSPASTETTPIPMEQRSAADTVSHSISSPVDKEILTDSGCVDTPLHTLHSTAKKWLTSRFMEPRRATVATSCNATPIYQCVCLVSSVRILPHHSQPAQVHVEGGIPSTPTIIECTSTLQKEAELEAEDSLVFPTKDNTAKIVLTNYSGFTGVLV